MAENLNRHKFIIIALVFYLAGVFVAKKQTSTTSVDININKFEQILHLKEAYITNFVDSVAQVIDTCEIPNFTPKPFTNLNQLNNFTEQGYSLLIYNNDTLTYWSDNLFDVPKIYSHEIFDPECNKIGSYWVDIHTQTIDNYVIIGIYRIKAEYEIQNKYLKSAFQKDLKLPENISISLIPVSYSFDVTNINGDYLLSLIPNNKVFSNYKFTWLINLLFLLFFVFLFLYLNQIINGFYKKKRSVLKISIMLIVIGIMRFLMIYFKYPLDFYSLDLFDSQYFASSVIFPSIGDLFLNLLCIWLIIIHFFKIIKTKNLSLNNNSGLKNYLIAVSSSFSGGIVFILTFLFIKSFIINSNLNLDIFNILDLNFLSIVAFVNIALLVALGFYFLYETQVVLSKSFDNRTRLVYSLAGVIIAILVSILFGKYLSITNNVILLIINILIVYALSKKFTKSLYFIAGMAFVAAFTVTDVLISALITKQTEKYKLIAVDLVNQRDDVAELLLKDITQKMAKDPNMPTYAQTANAFADFNTEVENYLRRNYFKSYWNKYEISVDLCPRKQANILEKNCDDKFAELLQNDGQWVDNFLYFVSLNNGKNFYVVVEPYPINETDTAVFYITLAQKLYPKNIGYPELLLDETVELNHQPTYSYAKYENNELSLKSGSYDYPLKGEKIFATDKQFYNFNEKNLTHLVYNLSDGNYIVLTYKRITFWNGVISFSYIFLFFIVLLGLVSLIINFKNLPRFNNLNFRTKLILAMFVVLTLTFSLVGLVTVLMNINQFKEKHHKDVLTKLQAVSISITQEIGTTPPDSLNFQTKIRKLSEIFGTDINLYNKNGFLIATSRPEIYDLDIIGKRISAAPLYQLDENTLVQFVRNEQISNMSYSSAYVQIIVGTKRLSIVNIPYFTNPDALRSEISNLIVSIVNIYVVLFVIAMIFSILMSEQIISPLIVLQHKFKKLELGSKYEKIEYKRKDEIGQLVEEYNKMVEKLQESIEKLSQSERESAWRDMAKQIAHEIKNPLTPMKLSIQLLMRSWENQDADFDQRIRNVTETMITQIETLRRIAEEFSEFAKMPKPQQQIINLADKIEEICKLYENTENVEVVPNLHNYREAKIIADDRQISRALINLIKNGIQAIPEGVQGKIIVDLDVFGNKAQIKIIDNGSGIPEEIRDKLFVPSFTTKSSGMGIGLPMVKNIITNANGKISFKSEVGKGTTFILEFPLADDEAKL